MGFLRPSDFPAVCNLIGERLSSFLLGYGPWPNPKEYFELQGFLFGAASEYARLLSYFSYKSHSLPCVRTYRLESRDGRQGQIRSRAGRRSRRILAMTGCTQ